MLSRDNWSMRFGSTRVKLHSRHKAQPWLPSQERPQFGGGCDQIWAVTVSPNEIDLVPCGSGGQREHPRDILGGRPATQKILVHEIHADVVELADTRVLEARAERREGSNPFIRTNYNMLGYAKSGKAAPSKPMRVVSLLGGVWTVRILP